KAFDQIINEQMEGVYPKRLNCDREFGFMERVLEPHGVTMKFSDTDQPYKNSIVERVIRTLRQLFSRWRLGDTSERAGDWPSVLQDLIDNYNNTYHGTIKAKPINVWKGRKDNHQKIEWIPTKMHVG